MMVFVLEFIFKEVPCLLKSKATVTSSSNSLRSFPYKLIISFISSEYFMSTRIISLFLYIYIYIYICEKEP